MTEKNEKLKIKFESVINVQEGLDKLTALKLN